MSAAYHNTTDSRGRQLEEYEAKAITQDQRVLRFFQSNPNATFTPSEVLNYAFSHLLPRPPVTSVRRAMSNLTAPGKLEKTTEQRIGPYGRPEYTWRLHVPELDRNDYTLTAAARQALEAVDKGLELYKSRGKNPNHIHLWPRHWDALENMLRKQSHGKVSLTTHRYRGVILRKLPKDAR